MQIDIKLRAAKGVDRLLGVAYEKDALGSLGYIGQEQRFEDPILDAVGILKLINQDSIVTIADAFKGRIATFDKRLHLGQKCRKALNAMLPLEFTHSPRSFFQEALEKRF